jgi:hypothetical protein
MNTASYTVTIRVPQSQNHTIWSEHIEQPKKRFIVGFDSVGYVNVLYFADTHRRVFVLAETPEGTLAIARYHHGFRGSNFELIGPA